LATGEEKERLEDRLIAWHCLFHMTREEIVEGLVRNDPPVGPTPTHDEAETLLSEFLQEMAHAEALRLLFQRRRFLALLKARSVDLTCGKVYEGWRSSRA
jgi:hypothetical protein